MGDTEKEKKRAGSLRRFLLRSMLLVSCLSVLALFALKVYLNSPYAAALVSRLLTSSLHQPVRVTGLHTSGLTFQLRGVSLGNPSGFQPGNLFSADSITIAPHWLDLLFGRRNFRDISLAGLRLDLQKNSAGVWNFSALRRLFAARKAPAPELSVGRFSVNEGTLLVNGRGARGISLQLANLKTKGSSDASFALSFEDPAGNAYSVKGRARPGSEPAFDLTLAAPLLDLGRLGGMLKLNSALLPSGGQGSLRLSAGLQHDILRIGGRLDFSRLRLSLAKGAPPLQGSLTLAADYDSRRDLAHLESLALTVGDLLRLHAAGTAGELKTERSFDVAIGIDELDLAALSRLLPEDERQRAAIAGRLSAGGIRISGNARTGVTAASGSLSLRGCSLQREGRLYFMGLDSSLLLSASADGFMARGSLSQREPHGSALLETLTAPFEITFSRRMKIIKAELPALEARIMGLALSGRLGFYPTREAPYSVALRIPSAPLARVQELPGLSGLGITGGSGSLSLDASGRGVRDFGASAVVRLANLQGSRGNRRFAVKSAAVDTRMTRNNGRIVAAGNADFGGLALDARALDGRFTCSYADGAVLVSNAALRSGTLSASIARLAAKIPVKEATADTVRYPLALDIGGAEIRQGQAVVNGFSGTLAGGYVSASQGDWLDGTASVSAGSVAWQGKSLTSPTANLTFSRSGARGVLNGKFLDGVLSGDISFKPFAIQEGGSFQVGIKGVKLTRVADLLPRQGAVTPAAGTLDLSSSGSYTRPAGLDCRFRAKGTGIALSGSGAKTLVSGAGLDLSGSYSGERVVIGDALLTAGEGVSLKARGAISKPLSPLREGNLAFSLSPTSANSIVDVFANILPRFIQEATFDGSLAGEGSIGLHDGRQLLEGTLLFRNILLDVPSQKFKAAEINGSLPFSLDFSGKTALGNLDPLSFSRANYPRILERFRSLPQNGQSVRIGRISFGTLELDDLLLRISAGKGITRIESLTASLFDGYVLGSGFVAFKKGLNCRADLLINDLSLRRLCMSIPKIKDYISGRLDGVISINAEGKSLTGLTGFTDLWAREGSGEKMKVSKEFLQKMSGRKLSGFFFREDRSFDRAEIVALLQDGNLTFENLDISHTNLFGIRDLSVKVAPNQNRIAIVSLFNAIKQAAVRGKAAAQEGVPAEPEFKWQE